jgi:hypothetical protein
VTGAAISLSVMKSIFYLYFYMRAETRIVVSEGTAVARKRLKNAILPQKTCDATIEELLEAVFSTAPAPRLCS